MSKKKSLSRKLLPAQAVGPELPVDLLTDVRTLIEPARDATARAVNSTLVLLYWQVGTRIRKDILKEKRAEHGQEILPTLSAKLAPEYREGFGKRNLFRMPQLAVLYPDRQIVSTVSRQSFRRS